MIDNLNLYRSHSGYIELEKIPNIIQLEKTTYGSREKMWFQLNEQQLLFKKNMRENEDMKEIINELISQFLNIECAQYDLATFQGQKGVIVRQFLKPNDLYKPTICLLCGDHNHKISNDIYTILQALEQRQIDAFIIKENIQKLMENQVQDVFTSQFDRNLHNTGFIQRNGTFLMAPRHDSANSFLNIFDVYKIDHFLNTKDKEKLIQRYKGTRTKLKMMPNSSFQTSMEELVNCLYEPQFENMPKMMQEIVPSIKRKIQRLQLLEFKEIFYIMSQYNQEILKRQQQFFEYIFHYNVETYCEQKKKLLK